MVKAEPLRRIIEAVARPVEGGDGRPSAVIKATVTTVFGELGAAHTDTPLLIAGAIPTKGARFALSRRP